MDAFAAAMIVEGEYELAGYDDNITKEVIIDAHQYLINTGLAWELQGRIGRQSMDLIEKGYCHLPEGI